MKVILTLITLFTNPGFIYDCNEKRNILKLNCEEVECYFDLQLKQGDYKYITESRKDTVTFLISDNLGAFILRKTENEPYIFQIIQ